MELRTERRIDGKVRLLRIAAVLCAAFAAAGIASGMHEASPDSGWIVPAFAGIVAATALAVFWHVVIGASTRMVRMTTIAVAFVAALGMTVIAIGASAQAIAVAVAGRAALSAELSLLVDNYGHRLAEAYGQATGWSAVATSAAAKSTGYARRAETETSGANGYGKGCGPRCASLRDISDAFSTGQAALNALLADAAVMRDDGDAAMAQLRDAAARGDQPGFMAGAGGVSRAIAALNAVDPRPIVTNTGAVVTSEKGIDLTAETKDFHAVAEKALADRHSVDAPVFRPMTLGEATRRQIFGAAAHAWVLAGSLDVLPFILLILAFAMSREVGLNEQVQREKQSPEDRDEADRKRLESMTGRKNVVPFQQPAE